MVVRRYEYKGKEFYRATVHLRGKQDKRLRIQRSKFGFTCPLEAAKEEKRLLREITEQLSRREGPGVRWCDVIDRWEDAARQGHLGDKYQEIEVRHDHLRRLNQYTKHWFKTPACELNRGDGRRFLNDLKAKGLAIGTIKHIKSSIHIVYNWAIEERIIVGVRTTPMFGFDLRDKVERVPPILTLEEVKLLLEKAKEQNSPWYHIWAFALLTGMRSGELYALRWTDVDFDKGTIMVSRSYHQRSRREKSTKAGYWRNIPVSTELLEILIELKAKTGNTEFVLPHEKKWHQGTAGEQLRAFLGQIGINKDVVFHTLRACFATHCLASGTEPAKVMKIGGWMDFKTFQIYVRLAGVEVKGATESLKILPKAPFAAEVIPMFS